MNIIKEDNIESPRVTAKDLAPKLRLLYSVAIGGFVHHINSVACKSTYRANQ